MTTKIHLNSPVRTRKSPDLLRCVQWFPDAATSAAGCCSRAPSSSLTVYSLILAVTLSACCPALLHVLVRQTLARLHRVHKNDQDTKSLKVINSFHKLLYVAIIFTRLIMASRQLCWLPAIMFYRCNLDLLFSPPNLRGRLADRHQTLPHAR